MSGTIELTCVVCPWGCELRVEGQNISGYSCLRGYRYALAEQIDPRRHISGSVRISGGLQNVVPVKTSAPLPKDVLVEAAALLDKVAVTSPINTGDIIIHNVLDTGVDFIAARSM